MRVLLVLALAAALTGCGGDDAGGAPAAVAVRGFLFQPSPLEITAGTTVTWTNEDDILHTATSGAPDATTDVFDGRMDGRGTSFSFTFGEPGTYAYFCSRHESMRGEVTVT